MKLSVNLTFKDGVTQDEADRYAEIVRKEIERIVQQFIARDVAERTVPGTHTHTHFRRTEEKRGIHTY